MKKKNKIAQQLAYLRWKGTTKAQRKAHSQKMLQARFKNDIKITL